MNPNWRTRFLDLTSWKSRGTPRKFRDVIVNVTGTGAREPNDAGARVSALLFADTMRAWRVASELPELWVNPWPVNPMPPLPPFATITVEDKQTHPRGRVDDRR